MLVIGRALSRAARWFVILKALLKALPLPNCRSIRHNFATLAPHPVRELGSRAR